jgi:hypothetical protein
VLRLFIAPTFLLTSIHPQEDSEELGGIAVGSSSCAGEMEDFYFCVRKSPGRA